MAALVGAFILFSILLELSKPSTPSHSSGLFNFAFLGVFPPAVLVIWRRRGTLLRRLGAFGVGASTALVLTVLRTLVPLLWLHYSQNIEIAVTIASALGTMVLFLPIAVTFAVQGRESARQASPQ